METGHPSTRAVNSGSGNRALVWVSAAAWRCSTFIMWTGWTLEMTCSDVDDNSDDDDDDDAEQTVYRVEC